MTDEELVCWHMEQLSHENGFLFYTLRQDGWRRGEPIMVNDVTIRLESTPGSKTNLEPIATCIITALLKGVNNE